MRFLGTVTCFVAALLGLALHVRSLRDIDAARNDLWDTSASMEAISDLPLFAFQERDAEREARLQRAREREAKEEARKKRAQERLALAARRATQGWWMFVIGTLGAPLLLPGFSVVKLQGRRRVRRQSVFLSYNHRDLELAKSLKEDLQEAGLEVELVEQVLGLREAELAEYLKSRIQRHTGVVVLLSPNSIKSDWVAYERGLADMALPSIIYACSGMSMARAAWSTSFLTKHMTGKLVPVTKAIRRYVAYPHADAVRLIRGLLAISSKETSSVRQYLLSFGSLDRFLFTLLFNWSEARLILSKGAPVWGFINRGCRALQTYVALIPIMLVLNLMPVFLMLLVQWLDH